MKWRRQDPWNLTPKQAMELQSKLRGQVVKRDDFGDIHLIAGLDAAFDKERRRCISASSFSSGNGGTIRRLCR